MSSLDEPEYANEKFLCKRKSRKSSSKVVRKCKQCDSSHCELAHSGPDVLQMDRDSTFTPAFQDLLDSPIIAPVGPKKEAKLPSHDAPSQPELKIPAQSKHWPKTGSQYPESKQREQPVIKGDNAVKGDRYTIVGIINGAPLSLVIDSGAFLSIVSKPLVQKLNLKTFKVPKITGRAATGPIEFEESCVLNIDVGIVKFNVVAVVATHPQYSKDLILLGSNFLKDLGVVADFTTNTAFIKNKFPVRMYTNSDSIEKHIKEIKKEFMSFSAIELRAPRNILIPANDSVTINIRVTSLEAAQLEGTMTYACSDKCPLGTVSSPDMVIDEDFSWRYSPLKLKLVNDGNDDQLIMRNTIVSVLKPLTSRALARKLGDDMVTDFHILETMDDDDNEEEEVMINALLDGMDVLDGEVNALGDKRPRNDDTSESEPPNKKAPEASSSPPPPPSSSPPPPPPPQHHRRRHHHPHHHPPPSSSSSSSSSSAST